MGLSGALGTTLTGLTVAQKGIGLVAGNVANADTEGYTKKTLGQTATLAGGNVLGAHTTGVNRELDSLLQKQMRNEAAVGGYTATMATYHSRIDEAFGEPGSSSSLDGVFNTFLQSMQALSTSPDDYGTRVRVVGDAEVMADRLNALSNDIQGMREEAETGLANAVDEANAALAQIKRLNDLIVARSGNGTPPADMLDERDRYIDQLAQLMDIKVIGSNEPSVSIFTASGVSLFDGMPAEISFDRRASIGPETLYSTDPAERAVGTITVGVGAQKVDLIATGAIRSGEIAAYIELRDEILVEAQGQIDEMAAMMATALSNRDVAGTAATVGAQTGFDVDLAGLQSGNPITLTYTDVATSAQHTVTFIAVNDPASLPLGDDATSDPNDTVYGIDFSGGMAAAAAQIGVALGAGFTVSNPAGTTLRILDDGAANTTDVNGLSASVTQTSLTAGAPELPFFVEKGTYSQYYTGSFDGGSQKHGFAQRITVNSDLVADPSRLVVYSTAPQTASGDATRPMLLIDRLKADNRDFQLAIKATGQARSFTGSIGDYMREVVSFQGSRSEIAQRQAEGQDIVVNSLRERFHDASGVDIDQELARLTQLQTSYAANARVMSTVKEMLDILMQM